MEQVAIPAQQQKERKKINHRPNRLLRERPRHPLTPYNLYIQEFINRCLGSGDKRNSRLILQQGANQWRTLPRAEVEKYVESCQAQWDAYHQDLEAWKNEKQTLKRPAPPYAAFLREIWQEEHKALEAGNPKRSFIEVSKYASQAWFRIPYKSRFDEETEHYREKIAKISEERMKADELLAAQNAEAVAAAAVEEIEEGEARELEALAMEQEGEGEEREMEAQAMEQGEAGQGLEMEDEEILPEIDIKEPNNNMEVLHFCEIPRAESNAEFAGNESTDGIAVEDDINAEENDRVELEESSGQDSQDSGIQIPEPSKGDKMLEEIEQ